MDESGRHDRRRFPVVHRHAAACERRLQRGLPCFPRRKSGIWVVVFREKKRKNSTINDDSEYCLCRGSFLDEAIYHSKLTIAAAALRLCSLSARFVIDATLPFRSLAEK